MLYEYSLNTPEEGFCDITAYVKKAVAQSGVREGTALVYCPHTTAGITVNENADPDVVRDMLLGLKNAFPDNAQFRHFEGNSTAHLKSSCVGCSRSFIIKDGAPLLGRWQGIYFCEFDGPRERRYFVKVLAG